MGWKYIVIETKQGRRQPFIFPDAMVHDTVFQGLRKANRQESRELGINWTDPIPVSAGFIAQLVVDGVGGVSETLKLGAHPTDQSLINGFNYNHGIPGTY